MCKWVCLVNKEQTTPGIIVFQLVHDLVQAEDGTDEMRRRRKRERERYRETYRGDERRMMGKG